LEVFFGKASVVAPAAVPVVAPAVVVSVATPAVVVPVANPAVVVPVATPAVVVPVATPAVVVPVATPAVVVPVATSAVMLPVVTPAVVVPAVVPVVVLVPVVGHMVVPVVGHMVVPVVAPVDVPVAGVPAAAEDIRIGGEGDTAAAVLPGRTEADSLRVLAAWCPIEIEGGVAPAAFSEGRPGWDRAHRIEAGGTRADNLHTAGIVGVEGAGGLRTARGSRHYPP